MGMYSFTGVVVDRSSQLDLAQLRVEAWDVAHRMRSAVASAACDETGSFVLTIDEADVKAVFGGAPAEVCFRVLHGLDVYGSTERSLRWRMTGDAKGRIEIDGARVLGRTPATSSYVLEGIVSDNDGEPVPDVVVSLYRRDISGSDVVESPLGTTVPRANGRFRISYDPQQSYPEVVVRAVQGRKEVVAERTLCRAQPFARVELVRDGDRYVGRTRFKSLLARLESSSIRDLAALTADQREHLACRLREPGVDIDRLVAAAQLHLANEVVEEEVYFALMSPGAPTTALDIFSNKIPVLRQKLLEAAEARVVSPRIVANIEAHVESLETAAVGTGVGPAGVLFQPLPGKLPLGVLASTAADLSPEQHRQFVRLAIREDRPADALWAAVAADASLGATAVSALRFTLEAAPLVGNVLPVLQRLQLRRAAGQVTSAKDLASLSDADWDAVIGTDLPPDASTAGQFKAAIKAGVEGRFRTAYLAARVKEADPNSELANFFTNHPTFDFMRERVTNYVANHPVAASGPLFTRLKDTQRLMRITDTWAHSKALYDKGYASAAAVHAKGSAAFVDDMTSVMDPSIAKNIFERACWVSAAAAGMALKYSPKHDRLHLKVLPVRRVQSTPSEVADWETLFGPADACACEQCQSVYGASAYLVDLLQFLKKQSAGSGLTALDRLVARRPDIGRIKLSCADAHTALPYVDLVNELLELKVAKAPTSWPERDVEVESEEGELAAHPEITFKEEHVTAYVTLAQSVFPFALPFHLWVEEARLYLEHLGLRRDEVIRLFGAAGTASDWVAAERLRLSLGQREILLTDAPPPDAWRYWGFSSATGYPSTLGGVPQLLERSALTFAQLKELISIRWGTDDPQNPAGGLILDEGLGCDPATMTVSGLDDTRAWFLHRFLRLRHALGWSVTTLDKALLAFGSIGAISADLLVQLGHTVRLQEATSMETLELCALWADLDIDSTREKSLYERVFLDKRLENQTPDHRVLRNLMNGEPIPGDASIRAMSGTLQAALGVSDRDLRLVLDEATARAELGLQAELQDDAVSLANLSRVYRIARFARAAGVGIRDLLAIRALANLPGMAGDRLPSTGGNRPADTAALLERIRAVIDGPFSVDEILFLLRETPAPSDRLRVPDITMDVWHGQLEGLISTAAADAVGIEDPGGETCTELLPQVVDAPDPAAATTLILDILKGLSGAAEGEQRQSIEDHLAHVLEDVAAAKSILVGAAAPSAEELADRYRYLAKRLVRYANARTAVRQWVATTFKLEPATARYLLESGLLTTAGGEPVLQAFVAGAMSNEPSVDRMVRAELLRRMGKAALVTTRLKLSTAQLVALQKGAAGGLPLLAFNSLPVEPPAAPADPEAGLTAARAGFEALMRMVALVQLRDRWPAGANAFFELFELEGPLSPILDRLAHDSGWGRTDLETLVTPFGLTEASFRNELTLLQLEEAFKALYLVGASAAQAISWADLAAPLPIPVQLEGADLDAPAAGSAIAIARDIKQVARGKHSDEQWNELAAPIRNVLRDRQRAALVTHLIFKEGDVGDANDLYGKMLVDVEMGPLMRTSRIVQANGSIQQFVQRALLGGLEEWRPNANAAREWEWMKNYRVWEANRKVFLYPENWIEPELRDDKTPLFKALERQLRQGELTLASAENAYRAYVDGLIELSQLDVIAIHTAEQSNTINWAYGSSKQIVHVFGRTVAPRKHYYRRREGGAWSAWERVDLDIDSEHLMPLTVGGRLYLFWLVSEEVARTEPPAVDDEETSTETPTVDDEKTGTELRVGVAYSHLDATGAWARPSVLDHELWIALGSVPKATSWCPFATADEVSRGTIKIRLWATTEMTESKAGAWTQQLGEFTLQVGAPLASSERYFQMDAAGHAYEDSGKAFIPDNKNIHLDPLRADNQRFAERKSSTLRLPAGDFGDSNIIVIPGAHTITADRQPGDPLWPANERSHLVVRDNFRSLFVELQKDPIGWHTTVTGDISVAVPGGFSKMYRVEVFSHPFAYDFSKQLALHGVDGLLRWTDQGSFKLQLLTRPIDDIYLPYSHYDKVVSPIAPEEVDFRASSPFGVYNWEMFFHVPFYIATRLMREQRYADARKWLHYIFDPTDGSNEEAPQKFWKVRPFYENKDLQSIIDDLTALSVNEHIQDLQSVTAEAATQPSANLMSQISRWRQKPFNPHAIARLRPLAYQKAVVMRYIENLVAWGDQLFARDTMESISEATQLYVLAQDLLGKRPSTIEKDASEPLSYNGLPAIDAFSNALVDHELIAPPSPPKGVGCDELEPVPYTVWGSTYFCIPNNDRLLGLWDVVADRLFKVRNSLNLEGVLRELPLFEPPIDPALLVRATAAGLDISSVLNDIAVAAPAYRYSVLYPKALEMAHAVQSFGAALLATLEKKDSEGLAMLRATNDVATQDMVREIRLTLVKEAQRSLQSLQESRRVVEERLKFYESAPEVSEAEQEAFSTGTDAQIKSQIAQGISAMGKVVALIPDSTTGISGPGPVQTLTIGGTFAANAAELGAAALNMEAADLAYKAQKIATRASYERRFKEYQLQARLAQKELKQIDVQIQAAELRLAVANQEFSLAMQQLTQMRNVESYLRSKYTNEELYDWMVGETAAVYNQAYKLAYETAKKAQRAFQFERGDETQTFIEFGYWDGLKRGLLAGEKLAHDLRRMDAAYIAQGKRELELVKFVSLAEHDPDQLVQLRETRVAELRLTEDDYDRDFDNHYLRRLKSVSVTIPCTTPPHQGVHGTLTLLKAATRRSSGPTSTVDEMSGMIQSIATSHGQSDPGLLELSFRDERLLPFEGAGAHVKTAGDVQWRFELSKGNRFTFESIDDLVLELRYTARQGGARTAPAGRTVHRLLRVRDEFRSAWQALKSGASNALVLDLAQATWQRGRNETPTTAAGVRVYGWWSTGAPQSLSMRAPGESDDVSLGAPSILAPGTARKWTRTLPAPPAAGSWTFIPPDPATLKDLWIVVDYTVTVGAVVLP